MIYDVDGVKVELWTGGAPVKARSASDRTEDWPFWFLTDDGRRNIMRFPDKPGAVFSDRGFCERAVEVINA